MEFSIRQAETDAEWNFFFKLSFETLKSMTNRRSMYDQIVEANPGKSDTELMEANRKEMEEYTDFSNPKSRVFIVENDAGEYCGYLWMGERNSMDHWDFQRPQWIYDIVVDSKFRGNGLGKLLMKQAEQFALEMDQNIGLFVHEDNTSAINLYKTEGYFIKNIPMSMKIAENLPEPEIEGYMIRERIKADNVPIHEIGLKSFNRMVRLSKDITDEQIREKYDEYLEKIEKMERKHSVFVVEGSDGSIAGYIFIGIPEFSEKVGLIYDAAIAPEHENVIIARALISQAASWCSLNGLSILYYLLHVQDDISQQNLQDFGFAIPGFFMEKVLIRTV
ncbi:MAG: GNAT family N-acetyltransferase [Candidatus Thorarchaeota archaeon]